MDNYNFDLKDAIKSGVSPEQMMKEFQEQLATAQKEVEAETKAKQKNTNLTVAREELVSSALIYLIELDVLEEAVLEDDELIHDLNEALKAVEGDISTAFYALKTLTDLKFGEEKTTATKGKRLRGKGLLGLSQDLDVDSILNAFLSTL